MRWVDTAFVLAISPLSERDVVVDLLTATHGRLRTVAKFGATSKQRTTFQPGNKLSVEWSARLSSHMGHVRAEVERCYLPLILHDPPKLLMMHAIHALCRQFLYEHDVAESVFLAVERWYDATATLSLLETAKHYARFEYVLLCACGYGLDLASCAVTGTREHLAYISPKTGRAVSRAAGAPYHEKLFALPRFYQEAEDQPDLMTVLGALDMNAHFMQQRLCAEAERTLPEVRHRLRGALHVKRESAQ